MRGVWVQAKSVTTAENINRVIQRVRAGRFNAVFVDVFFYGETLHYSNLTRQSFKIEPGFDPLAYLITEAHRYNIQVHAWFEVGRVGNSNGSSLLARHPEWGLIGPDGMTTPWLNFTIPEVREFISDLMWEVVEVYNIDGIHFDYTRYPGSEWGFDPFSKQSFAAKYQLDLDQLRYADLPAYGTFEGNPLTQPSSAQILATFANGYPAVAFNRYGAGEVLLFNLDILDRNVAVGAVILQRALQRWLQPGDPVFILRSETNSKRYGYEDFDRAMAWLKELEREPQVVEEMEVKDLPSNSVLIFPNVYLVSDELVDMLEVFVHRGGRVIFFDGPMFSIERPKLQAIIGMRGRGNHFDGFTLMTASQEHPLLPISDRSTNLDLYQTRDAFFKEFRRQGINDLIRDIYQRVKTAYPDVDITATITSDQIEATQNNLQDWPTWLEEGYIDYLVPRGYVEQAQELEPILKAWQPFTERPNRIIMGIMTYIESDSSEPLKTPDQLMSEISLVHQSGYPGIIIFDLDHMDDEQLEALAKGPFSISTILAHP